MDMPTYEGIIEQWKVDLITTRAKLMGFRSHEMPDVLQELVLELLNFQYDPQHATGAKEQTALVYIIDNHLRKIRRSDTRYRAHVDRQEATEFSRDTVDELALDVATVVAGLPDLDQTICRHLINDMTKEQIAAELGCSWHTIDRAIERLRQHFRQIGLGGWVGK